MALFNDMTIGRLASQTDCTVPTIRFYEEIGLLPAATRSERGQRIYSETDVRRLTFIRRCRDFGFPIEQIRELVGLAGSPERDCTAARDLASARLQDVRKKLKEMRELEQSLKNFVEDCNERCAGGPAGDCVILEDLAAPQPCCNTKKAKAAGCCGSRSN